MMICNHCGQQVQDGAAQCPFCGAPLMQQMYQQNAAPNPQFAPNMNAPQQAPKKKHGCLIAILVLLGLSLFSAVFGKHDKKPNDSASIPDNSTVTTVSTENEVLTEEITIGTEERAETTVTTAAEEIKTITIIDGEPNEYSEEYTLNAGTEKPDTSIVYFLPAGRYKVKNIGDNMNQINVYSRETHITDAGWEEAVDGSCKLIDAGAADEIEIPEDYYIKIRGGAFELTPIS